MPKQKTLSLQGVELLFDSLAVVYDIALVGDSPSPADDGSDTTTFSVVCGYNGSPSTPPSNVAVVSSSLVVIGLNGTFEIPGN